MQQMCRNVITNALSRLHQHLCMCVGRIFIHPGSVNFNVGRFDSGWLVYTEMLDTTKVYVREASMVPVYALLLFGGGCLPSAESPVQLY